MSPWLRAGCIALAVLGIGLAAVYLEVEEVRCGMRVRRLMLEKEASVERVRTLQARYNRLLSPDLLERDLPEAFLMSDGPPDGGGELSDAVALEATRTGSEAE